MLELLAYALDAAVSTPRSTTSAPLSAVARISDAASRLEVSVAVDVTVDGDRWTQAPRWMTSDPGIASSRSTRTAASSSVTACTGNARRRGAELPAARASEPRATLA